MSSVRSAIRLQDTILFRLFLGMTMIYVVLITATYGVVDFVAKDYLIHKNKELINETGSHLVAELSRQVSVAETLTRTLATVGANLPKNPDLFLDIIPKIINTEGYHQFIAGGGILPEPEIFTPAIERRSFFWGRDGAGQLQYFDQYNDPNGAGYHNEEWYVPARYSSPGDCIWSKSYMDPYTLEPMVTCTVAMFNQQKFTGNATVDIKLKRLQKNLHDSSAKLGGYAYAVDRNNKFLSFPDDKLTKETSRNDNNNLAAEYITVTELAKKNKIFKPIADILNAFNLSQMNSAKENNQQIAEKIAQESYQISSSEAQLISANLLALKKEINYPQDTLISVINQQDLLLGEPVIVSFFFMPETMWKIIVVTPLRLAISGAEDMAHQILLLMVTIISISTILGFIFFRQRLTAPMYQMVNQLQRTAADNTEAQPKLLDDSRQDEFGLLAYHFNQSTQALDRNNKNLILQIKERKQVEQQFKHLALHDSLTNLPNRALFQDRLHQAIAQAKRNRSKFAVFFMDLDGFKLINDTQGHEIGDELLKIVGLRILATKRNADTVARFGGDEFAFIINKVESIDDTAIFAQRLNELLHTPMVIQNKSISISTSIGITIYPDDATDSKGLLRNADIAMYQAKESGRNTTRFFVNEMNTKLQRYKQILADLTSSLIDDNFELYYQPQFKIDNNKLVGAEALIRRHTPGEDMIPPAQFIPIAEQSGLINELGDWVLSQACRQIKIFIDAGIPPIRIAINISPVQFRRKDFLVQTLTILELYNVPSRYIELEITEGAMMFDIDEAIVTMQALYQAGFTLSIDDFGTGYSSLSYLKRFPIQKIKIDRSFIVDIEKDSDNKAITTAIIQMGHSLGLQILAEGVENEAQLQYLINQECDLIQGHYSGKAMAAAEFIERFGVVGCKTAELPSSSKQYSEE